MPRPQPRSYDELWLAPESHCTCHVRIIRMARPSCLWTSVNLVAVPWGMGAGGGAHADAESPLTVLLARGQKHSFGLILSVVGPN